jgi:5-methylcytosine-specific restriction endonuclease McrA
MMTDSAHAPETRDDASDARAQVDWQEAHAALVRLARSRAGLDFDEGVWLLAALRSEAHVRLGYGSFVEYAERIFGYAPRLTQDKLRVAESLETLPELAQALRDGAASWSSVRELTRVATSETEHAWLERARGHSVREIERLVSGHRPGSLPDDAPDPSANRHVLRFEVSGEALATFREAIAKIRREAGGPLDDDAALLLMARHVLEGPADEGRASYQVELSVCEHCQRAQQVGSGELVDVSAEVAAMARCDGQNIGGAHVGAKTSDSATTNQVTGPKRAARATQTVPPATRRSVLHRDQHRCQVPGCRHSVFVDVHHIRTREEGGGHELDNLVTLCGAHHRASHSGELTVQGSVSSGLSFRHADGTDYGGAVVTADASIQTAAFRALRGLGFGERETRGALSQVAAHAGTDAPLEAIVRRALQLLSAGALAQAS